MHPRIVSLVPSITETLYYLGLQDYVIGRTRYCIHPKGAVENAVVVGGTKKVVRKRVVDLDPDLIIANKEENSREDVEFFSSLFPVHVTDVTNYHSALEMITELGRLTGSEFAANQLVSVIETAFAQFADATPTPSVIYLIWKDPYMAAGRDTFISDMISKAGFRNIILQKRYPELTMNEIKNVQPDLIFLSSEPYPFGTKHIEEFASLKSKVVLVDGEMFSWYGNRMKFAAQYFLSLRDQLT